jgi:hypothetical protein
MKKETTLKTNADTTVSEDWKAQRSANFKTVLREWMMDDQGAIHIPANDDK